MEFCPLFNILNSLPPPQVYLLASFAAIYERSLSKHVYEGLMFVRINILNVIKAMAK